MIKLFLDDERSAPKGWVLIYTVHEAISCLNDGLVEEISLDHDLGNDKLGTGYDVILWIENEVVTKGFKPPKIIVHSANPPARKRMEAGIKNIHKLYKKLVLEKHKE